jgi:uncharacterized RDD family membrane protein YckC
MTTLAPLWGLPDPDTKPEFYADVPTKRFFAWLIDTALITLITVLIVPFTAFTALFFLPLLFLTVSLFYRIVSIARRSATPGMRLVALEFRTHEGQLFDLPLAAIHSVFYTISVSMVFPQVVSAILMLTTARAQGLSDMVLGTAAVNRAAGY